MNNAIFQCYNFDILFSINFSVAIFEVRVEDCLCCDGDYDDINTTTNNSSYVKVTETSKLAALYLKLKLQHHIPNIPRKSTKWIKLRKYRSSALT